MANLMNTQRKSSLVFSSHGKLLLFGEHAVLFGHPAVGLSLSLTSALEIYPGDTHYFPGLSSNEQKTAHELLRSAKHLMPNITIPPAEYRLAGSIPLSAGLGSSAAFCVSFARYLYQLCQNQNIDLTPLLPTSTQSKEKNERLHRIWQIANQLERIFHGNPSGIDTGLACRNGLQAFFPRYPQHPQNPRKIHSLPRVVPIPQQREQLWLVYGAIPRLESTKELVRQIQQGMHNKCSHILSAMEQLGTYSHAAIGILLGEDRTKHIRELAELALKAQHELAVLKLNHASMDDLLEQAMHLGSLGGKLSGAGNGGAFYFFCESKDTAMNIQRELTIYSQRKQIPLICPLNCIAI